MRARRSLDGGSECALLQPTEQSAREDAAHIRGLDVSRKRTRNGNESNHWRTGAWGSTWSTRCAVVSAMRLPQQEGQKPRLLQVSATSSSRMQRGHCTRAKPWASRPHSR